jgi:hypothetical protein
MVRRTINSSDMVVARTAIVVVVGARPCEYRKITVTARRTGERVEILDTDHDPIDPGDEGVGYAFRAFQKVNRNHPAVLANPGAFIDASEVDEPADELAEV